MAEKFDVSHNTRDSRTYYDICYRHVDQTPSNITTSLSARNALRSTPVGTSSQSEETSFVLTNGCNR